MFPHKARACFFLPAFSFSSSCGLACDSHGVHGNYYFPLCVAQVGHGNAKSNIAEVLAAALCERQPSLTVRVMFAGMPYVLGVLLEVSSFFFHFLA